MCAPACRGYLLFHMTPDQVLARLPEVREAAVMDAPQAHRLEDLLLDDVLGAIADGAPQAQKLAQIAIQTDEIEFRRSYADAADADSSSPAHEHARETEAPDIASTT